MALACSFCKHHHYDETKLYQHMELDHFHCFICRRQNPEKYKYYSTYEELDKHFAADHFPCPYPRCINDHFVAFASEQELKRHVATEHADEANLSKADRKQAMTVATGFSVRRPAPPCALPCCFALPVGTSWSAI